MRAGRCHRVHGHHHLLLGPLPRTVWGLLLPPVVTQQADSSRYLLQQYHPWCRCPPPRKCWPLSFKSIHGQCCNKRLRWQRCFQFTN